MQVDTEREPPAVVVVAVDDSDSSRAALGWAAGYASTTGARLSAVHVHHHELVAPPLSGQDGDRSPDEKLVEIKLRRLVSATLHTSTEVTFLRGFVGREVVRFAQQASLLVVGTGEHRGAERILVSSVSHYCLSHASCPVVAVPAPAVDRLLVGVAPAAAGGAPL